jgi:hypothetical protein
MSGIIKIYNCVIGKYYNYVISPGNEEYVGKYVKMDSRERENSLPHAPIYVFEHRTFQDKYPAEFMREVEKQEPKECLSDSG